jgi:hypothetical protein
MAGTKRKEWTIYSISSAAQAVKQKEMTFLKATKTFIVPRSTSLDNVKSENFEERLSCSTGRKCALGNNDNNGDLTCQVMLNNG